MQSEGDPIIRVTILTASQSGTAVHVAEALKERIEGVERYHVTLIEEGDLPDLSFTETEVLLMVISTHGEGEVPDPFLSTYGALLAAQPDLSGLRYGVVALGDTTYHQTFCGAGRLLDSVVTQFGATRVGDRCEIDASSQPFADEDALAWLEDWLVQL